MTTFLLGYRRAVFIDTSAFYASLDRREGTHRSALQVFNWIAQERIVPYTTNFVMAECHALIVSRLGQSAGVDFVDMIERGVVELEWVSVEEEFRARAILRYHDKTFSYTDATSFVVMERLGLRDAFSFDGDFSQYGFRTLPDT